MLSRSRTLGRLRVIEQLTRSSDGFSLSAGSKSTKLADVNVDQNKGARPDIVATIFHLPFGPEIFDTGNHPYTVEKISRIVIGNGWRIEHLTVSGGIWEAIGLLTYYFIEYPLSRILRQEVPGPVKLSEMADTQYGKESKMGYTIFMVCSREEESAPPI